MFFCLWLAHSLIIAAYLLHECMHNTIFKSSKHNEILGKVLSWFTGAVYTPYEILKQKHLRHHADRVDVLLLDTNDLFGKSPLLTWLAKKLQYVYVPAFEILTHVLSILAPFYIVSRKQYRGYVIRVITGRLVFFLLLASIEIMILLAYFVAYLLFLFVLGFMDTFQHLYEVRYSLNSNKVLREFDREYEESHTFSNLISQHHPWLNLLVLNFCYHNVHHYKSGLPWHELPDVHESRYRDKAAPVICLGEQLRRYHRERCNCFSSKNSVTKDVGATGVSFLVGI
ncbi:MAG: fatty acid desaturase [Gammaproteobacteria bacterium]|nr:fatty acid desaturase [Gammaproteobacteria bacterium]